MEINTYLGGWMLSEHYYNKVHKIRKIDHPAFRIESALSLSVENRKEFLGIVEDNVDEKFIRLCLDISTLCGETDTMGEPSCVSINLDITKENVIFLVDFLSTFLKK